MAPLLEHDIESLQALDDQRQRCRSLLESAARAIVVCVGSAVPTSDADWESANDDVEHAMVHRSLGVIARDSTLKLKDSERKNIEEARDRHRELLFATTIESLFLEKDLHDTSSLDRIPVFRACHILQALVEDDSPDSGPFCAPSVCALYRLMTEIYRVDAPKWMAGGVRASKGAPQSAFVTREAVRSILLIHKLLQNTAALLKALCDAKIACSVTEHAPGGWRTHVASLRRTDFKTSLKARSPHLLDKSMELLEVDDWADEASAHVLSRLSDQWASFRASVDELELVKPDSKVVSEGVHKAVMNRLNEVVSTAEKALAAQHGQPNSLPTKLEAKPDQIKTLGSAFEKAAAALLRIIDPCRSYLETELIAELSTEPGRSSISPDAAQAAFAAAALAEIDDASDASDPDDLRLRAATELASSKLSERSGLPIGAPFDVSHSGYRLPPQIGESIRAICDMYRYSTCACEPETARRLVRYFLETRADRPEEDRGWFSDTRPRERKSEIWVTALAFFALRDLLAMLDRQINQRILGHFTVRRPEDLKLGLDGLFLPDAFAAQKNPEKSVGVQLHKMQAHIEGVSPASDTFSVVLWGPPGTGKTTLIEALAKSSAAPLVEITPSDILIGGGAQVERHTRLVFSALSMLTRCVILFDEFDSILRKRSTDLKAALNEFQFLTPGLLPKLKNLHDHAAKQQVAYALATNFVGQLDPAAIRRGRFDDDLGIFPPDLLSRVGRLTGEMRKFHPQQLNAEEVGRAVAMVKKAAGYGMATLGKPGWFTEPKSHTVLDRTPFGYIFEGKPAPDFGDPESNVSDERDEDVKKEWQKVIDLDARGELISANEWVSYTLQVEAL